VSDSRVSTVRVEVTGELSTIVVDGPATQNAISRPTMEALSVAIDEIERVEPGAVAIRGQGRRVFVSGGDLKELSAVRTIEDAEAMASRMRSLLDRIAALPMPVVAVLNGSAFGGGCELAVACDFRIAADDIQLAFNQIALGIMPAWGGLERLSALVGYGRAMHLACTGEVLSATRANEVGLVEVVVPRDQFDERVDALLGSMAKAPAAALRSIKAVSAGRNHGHSEEDVAAAISAFAKTWVHDDHWAAVTRMTERRDAAKADLAK
jgi:enoyl-CoA hydratase